MSTNSKLKLLILNINYATQASIYIQDNSIYIFSCDMVGEAVQLKQLTKSTYKGYITH